MDNQLSSFLNTVQAAVGDDTQKVVHDAYTAVLRGDFDAFHATLTEDVELHIHGFDAMDGSWTGRKDVVESTRRNFGMVTAQKPEIERISVQGDSMIVLFREQGVFKETGRAYRIRCVQWFTVEGGKLKRIDEVVGRIE